MKVFTLPDQVKYDQPNYADYDAAAERDREERHKGQLKDWLLANGWPGDRTGQILREPHADGYACYMYADGPKAALIHLPYGDAWDSPNVEHLPKKEVLKRLDRGAGLAKLFVG